MGNNFSHDFVFTESISWPRRVFNWMCGIDEQNKQSLSSHGVVRQDMISIEEKTNWKRLSNVLAVVLMGVVVFHFIYFA